MPHLTRRRLLAAATAAAVAEPAVVLAGKDDPKPLKFRLGIVTYNIAAAWDVPTILKVCKNVGLSPVE